MFFSEEKRRLKAIRDGKEVLLEIFTMGYSSKALVLHNGSNPFCKVFLTLRMNDPLWVFPSRID